MTPKENSDCELELKLLIKELSLSPKNDDLDLIEKAVFVHGKLVNEIEEKVAILNRIQKDLCFAKLDLEYVERKKARLNDR